MPRTARASVGGLCYHVLNRGNARGDVFHKDGDFAAFVKLMALANARLPMRVLSYCLLNNHFHLVLWPHHDGDLSRWMQWLLTSHVRRYHRHYGSSGQRRKGDILVYLAVGLRGCRRGRWVCEAAAAATHPAMIVILQRSLNFLRWRARACRCACSPARAELSLRLTGSDFRTPLGRTP